MEFTIHEKLAQALKKAEKSCIAIEQISKDTNFTVDDAYKIQLINIERELSGGKKVTGKKIGLTSLAVQNMLGVNTPDFGHLLDSMEVKNNTIQINTMIQPKVEGEIAFVLKEDIKGPDATAKDVLNATEYVAAAIEIVDSRIKDWKISLIDTVADNASSGMYVISDRKIDPKTIDLKNIEMNLYKDSEKINSGLGSAVLGDPAFSVAWLANALSKYGVVLKKGEIVLSGALSGMLTAEKGNKYTANFSELGSISVKFE
ncbi:fumarylacetoacetate hydrolase family protein [Sedimentibacter hydroxybenzoicus DSM 7310]|uniref:Fumarylacetoacetate hydrolase family protein n=1 Tax=Sedimentibacter hydroxybenzoicus DSM 7310 TaxID=1123245 RepID=A0A974BKM5_SEDHY|nr:2-keto-4-pentenoate hydratase [Sedimentibacter hydroxybenzoicus]NYB75060.1 fumarylacetoacetate hydrolase family protein [Sedimentibacter hydroxybenzoicus DSM 7310]